MVVISDLHLGKNQDTIDINGVPSRLHDTVERCKEAVLYAKKRGSSLVIAGDVFDTATPNPPTISKFFDIVLLAVKHGVSVFIIPGNHDCGVNYMSMEFMNGVASLSENNKDALVKIINSPCAEIIDGLKVVFLPHVPKKVIASESYPEWCVEQLSEKETKNIDIVIGHAHIKGAVNSSDIELEAGDAINFNPSKFFKYKLGIFGHIHRHQVLGKNIYCGPITTNSFDEADIEKGFIYVAKNEEKTEPPKWRFVPYTFEDTKYKTINIDLINKDKIVYDEKKLTKIAKGKLLKIVVYAKDLMQVNQEDIKKNFEEYGQVVRFEIILADRYSGESKDEDIDEVFSAINYKPVFKAWMKDKGLTKEDLALVLELGYDVIAEVTNAQGD